MATTEQQIEKVREIAGSDRDIGEATVAGTWITFEQFSTKGATSSIVANLKAAGMIAFFNASQHTFGVKRQDI